MVRQETAVKFSESQRKGAVKVGSGLLRMKSCIRREREVREGNGVKTATIPFVNIGNSHSIKNLCKGLEYNCVNYYRNTKTGRRRQAEKIGGTIAENTWLGQDDMVMWAPWNLLQDGFVA